MSKTQRIAVRVTDEVREALERLAAADERSLSWHVQKALEAYLAFQGGDDDERTR